MFRIILTIIIITACNLVQNKYLEQVVYDDLNHIDGVAYYQDEVYSGKVVVFHENGIKKFEADYVNGVDNGMFKEWDEYGNLIEIANIKDGTFEGKRLRFHPNGKKQFEGYYKIGLLEGTSTEWYENGNLCIVKEVHNGVEDGKFIFYLESGEKNSEGLMSAGEKEGKWIEFDLKGLPIFNHYYTNGEIERTESLK